ncbi:Hypothetical predicted protein [Paramuricea clavata]|uniref:Uncharacterized protein n=1 Tax=Paramuricea clavata TaxID=317549 RepID=A0A7D9HMW8_PARCT|nr:Hypothetical predicted protein [Paramuricea clavata]
MDGVWKLRFPHCMYPVEAEIFSALNYPNVCTKEPASQNSAFCINKHCEVAREGNVPTGLRDFIHKYCGVPQIDKEETENLRASDGEIIETKLENMSGNEKGNIKAT